MTNTTALFRGRPVSLDHARAVVNHWAQVDIWEMSDVTALWQRLIDPAEEFEERLECAEMLCRLSRDELEIYLDEPIAR